MSKHLAAFYGAGISTSLGTGIEQNLAGLRNAPEPPQTLTTCETGEAIDIPYKCLADAPAFGDSQRLNQVLHDVIRQAIDEANLSAAEQQSMNVYIGSSSFDITNTESRYKRDLAKDPATALALHSPSFGNIADALIAEFDIRGTDFTFNTACTASANALLTAATHIKLGLVKHALVVGIELYNNVSALGFHGLGLLTKSVMRPFDKQRDGLILGEGVSAMVLGPCGSNADEFFLAGGASNSDTFNISSSNPDGSTIANVMQQALASADIDASQIDVIKAHGTASLSNDEAEAAGMFQAFEQPPVICALKPHLGHTLGACGLNELILFYRSVRDKALISTPGICATPCELNIQLNQMPTALAPGCFLLNYFGFGGNNSSLVISNKTLEQNS